MDVLATLHQDHALLRRKVTLLESALQEAPEARLVLRGMCGSLLRVLQDHMLREARALGRFQRRVTAGASSSELRDHSFEHHLLRGVNEWLLSGMKASIPTVVIKLTQVIEQLEAAMEAQERSVFPLLEREPAAPEERTIISGAMSVNEILQRYPQTERVFEQFRINRLQEGYESVDELAWRHGIEVSQVIDQLRQVAVFPGY